MDVLETFRIVCPWLMAAALVAAAISDVRSYEIPDTVSVLVGALFLAFAMTAPGRNGIVGAGIVAAIVFLAGLGLFSAGWFGGGDVKLLAATSLWAGPGLVAPFLMVTAMAGGVLSLAILLRLRIAGPASAAAQPNIPYGVAIAAGGIFVAARIAAV